jgi:hypothetical protein
VEIFSAARLNNLALRPKIAEVVSCKRVRESSATRTVLVSWMGVTRPARTDTRRAEIESILDSASTDPASINENRTLFDALLERAKRIGIGVA